MKLKAWAEFEVKLKGRPPRGAGVWELKLKPCAEGLEMGA